MHENHPLFDSALLTNALQVVTAIALTFGAVIFKRLVTTIAQLETKVSSLNDEVLVTKTLLQSHLDADKCTHA